MTYQGTKVPSYIVYIPGYVKLFIHTCWQWKASIKTTRPLFCSRDIFLKYGGITSVLRGGLKFSTSISELHFVSGTRGTCSAVRV